MEELPVSVLIWVIGICCTVIVALFVIIGYFGKRTVGGLEESLKVMTTSLTKFSDDIRSELGRMHARQDRTESNLSELRGEHKVFTKAGGCDSR